MSELGGATSPPAAGPAHPGAAPGLFGMLEERVGTLLERFQQAQKRIEDLEAELAQRDAQAGVLERRVEEFRLRLEGENRKREELRLRVSHLIEEISRIEARERKRASGKHPA